MALTDTPRTGTVRVATAAMGTAPVIQTEMRKVKRPGAAAGAGGDAARVPRRKADRLVLSVP